MNIILIMFYSLYFFFFFLCLIFKYYSLYIYILVFINKIHFLFYFIEDKQNILILLLKKQNKIKSKKSFLKNLIYIFILILSCWAMKNRRF